MSPRRALVPRKRVRASDFFNEIGKLMEPEQWNASWIDSLQDQVVKKDQSSRTALYVVNQLIEAVRLGIAEPEVRLTDQQQSELNRINKQETSTLTDERGPSSDEMYDEFDKIYLWSEEFEYSPDFSEDSSDTEVGFHRIDKEFWDSGNILLDIDWKTSLIKMPIRFIITDKR